MKQKRVAIIGIKGYPYVYGGYETLIKSIAERLVKENIAITIYCHQSLFENRPSEVNGIALKYIPAIESKSLSQLTHSFLSTIHACFCKYDSILYVNVANGPFGILPRIFGKKTIINVDGMEWQRPKWKGLGAIYYKFCANIVKYSFNTVITDAEEMKKTYEELFKTKSVMIPYGAEKTPSYDLEILKKLEISPNEYYLVVGRMIPDNNLDFIVEEFSNANSEKKLLIVGDDIFKSEYSKRIHEIIKANKNIIVAGYITNNTDLSTLYKKAYAYVHGHEFGGTNPTLVLALNESCLILALNTRFNKEVLNNGSNGFFFTKKQGSLVKLLDRIENEEPKESLDIIRNLGPERVDKHYNWDTISKQYLNILAD
jgi:glycosyltransferase involved in cell wall biosynthesis